MFEADGAHSVTWYLGETVNSPKSCGPASHPRIFNGVGNEGLDPHWCLRTGSTLPFHRRDCAKNRAGLGGGIGKWSGPRAGERKSWGGRGVFFRRLLPSETEGICSPSQDMGSCWHHGVYEHEKPTSCLFYLEQSDTLLRSKARFGVFFPESMDHVYFDV